MDLLRARDVLDRLADPLLALALLALGTYEVWIERGQVAGPRVVNAVFLVLATVPIAWRRRRPLVVLVIVAGAAGVWNCALYLANEPPRAVLACGDGKRATAVLRAGVVAAWILSTLPTLVSGVGAAGVVPAWTGTRRGAGRTRGAT